MAHTLYFIGNLNADLEAFRYLWQGAHDTAEAGDSWDFLCCGNFGLKTRGFAEAVSSFIRKTSPDNSGGVSLCGGHAGQEGWDLFPPPRRATEKAPAVWLHAYGDLLNTAGQDVLFLGRGSALPSDFFPTPRGTNVAVYPGKGELAKALALAAKNPPIVVSYLPPPDIARHFLAHTLPGDPRRRRLADPGMEALADIHGVLGRGWWFSAGLCIQGDVTGANGRRHISLMPVASCVSTVASLEARLVADKACKLPLPLAADFLY